MLRTTDHHHAWLNLDSSRFYETILHATNLLDTILIKLQVH